MFRGTAELPWGSSRIFFGILLRRNGPPEAGARLERVPVPIKGGLSRDYYFCDVLPLVVLRLPCLRITLPVED
jgi:hypothetical protein